MHVCEQSSVVISSQSGRKQAGFWVFLSVMLALCPIIFASEGLAAVLFVGTGNDGYFGDVHGLFSALQSVTPLDHLSGSFLFENRSGAEMATSIHGLGSVLGPGDTLIWYYSGHGSYASDANGDESAAGAFAQDAYDESIGLLGDTAPLFDDGLSNALLTLSQSSVRIITIFDTCYSGGFIGGVNDLNVVSGLTFLASSGEQEDSYAYDNDPFSIFTTGLINGLQGFDADRDGNGLLTAREWFDYAYDYTVESVAGQHPVFYGNDVLIASARPVPLPGAVWLLGCALLPASLLCMFRRPGRMKGASPARCLIDIRSGR